MSIAVNVVDRQAGFIIVNKPAGIGFHDDDEQLGFFNAVKSSLEIKELYPVHRLDKMTSGLLILATTKVSAAKFQQLFADKEIEKYYIALSDQKPKKKQGLIKGDMIKSRRGMWKLTRSMDNPAVSQFFSFSIADKLRLFVVKPHTGKTHQIRVALASIGSPIIGDNYYSKTSADRGYLHAYSLRFTIDQQSFDYQVPPDSGELFLAQHCQEKLRQVADLHQLSWPTV